MVASVDGVMKRSFERFVSSEFRVEDDVGSGFRVAGRRQEVTAKSQASRVLSFFVRKKSMVFL